MFDKVVEWLETASHGDEHGYSGQDVRAAVAAIYYHMIAVDGVITSDEVERFSVILKEQFRLNDAKLAELMQRGEEWDENSPGLFPFTVILNHEFSENKRRAVVEHLKELADSDGHRSYIERELLGHLQQLLKLD